MTEFAGYAALLELLESLTELLRSETAALRRKDFAAFERLQTDKLTLAGQYERQLMALSRNPAAGTLPDEALRARLRGAHDTFNRALAENVRTLDLARRSSERLIDRIVEAARKVLNSEPRPYGNLAQNFAAGRLPPAHSRPISVDTQL